MRTRLLVGLSLVVVAFNFLNWILGAWFQPAQYGDQPPHLAWQLLVGTFVLVYFASGVNIVDQWNRRPLMRFGRYVKTIGPGFGFVEPIIHNTLPDVSIRDQIIEVPVESVQTFDNISLELVGVLTFCVDENRVQDSVLRVEDVQKAVLQRALSTLADISGKTNIDTFLEHRAGFCTGITAELAQRVAAWGVTVKAFELKKFMINDEKVEQAIAMKARAKKEAEAELVRAQMQAQIAAELNKAGAVYDQHGRWLRENETLLEFARSANNSAVVVPTSILSAASGS